MKLYEILNIKKYDITSIVGAGGKTTLMFKLANELKDKGKVLVTTTTKIYRPNEKEVDYLYIGKDGYDFIKNNKDYGIYAYGEEVNKEDKLIGIKPNLVNNLKSSFDYILIEADGSKKKDLKAWNENEPIICSKNNKYIGVLSLKTINIEINNDNIHRIDEFLNLTNSNIGEKVSLEILIKLIFNKKGLFKNSMGENILFLNKAENIKDDILTLFLDKIINKNKEVKLLNKIVYGSLKYNSFNYIDL